MIQTTFGKLMFCFIPFSIYLHVFSIFFLQHLLHSSYRSSWCYINIKQMWDQNQFQYTVVQPCESLFILTTAQSWVLIWQTNTTSFFIFHCHYSKGQVGWFWALAGECLQWCAKGSPEIESETSTCTLECLGTCIRKTLMYVSVMKILIKNAASLSMNNLSFSAFEGLCVFQHLPGPDRQSPQRVCLADLLIFNN